MEDCMRIEMKIGLLLFEAFGLLNIFFNTPEFILGFLATLSISFMLVGGMSDDSYKRLKKRKIFLKR